MTTLLPPGHRGLAPFPDPPTPEGAEWFVQDVRVTGGAPPSPILPHLTQEDEFSANVNIPLVSHPNEAVASESPLACYSYNVGDHYMVPPVSVDTGRVLHELDLNISDTPNFEGLSDTNVPSTAEWDCDYGKTDQEDAIFSFISTDGQT